MREINDLKGRLVTLERENHSLRGELSQIREEINRQLKELSQILKSIGQLNSQQQMATKNASEAVWGEIFNNSITGCDWLKDRSFYPGRWALGYPALYVLFRILNNVKPLRILELGLGQSTRMTTQYASTNPDIEHIVVEHDNNWISFFRKENELSENTEIVQLDREFIEYKEAESVRVFHGFQDALKGKKFDFILIDAPLGGDMKQYSRIDVLSLLPECLDEQFVIMMDDAERPGEKNTIEEILGILKQSCIPFAIGSYSGQKQTTLICSEKLSFLTSM